jgi:Tfp pilus assembly protein FimT
MSNKFAYTLIELSVILVLIMIVATLVMTHGSYMHRILVHTEIEKLALVCRYVQNTALSTNTEKTIIFDLKNKSYSYDGCTEQLSLHVEFGTIEGAKGPPSNPKEQIRNAITFAHNKITFYPDGIIQSGTVYLVSSDRQIMYALSNPVSQTSYMRIYKYDGTWHCLT